MTSSEHKLLNLVVAHPALDLVCSKPRGFKRGAQDIKITAKYEEYTRKTKTVFYKVKSYLKCLLFFPGVNIWEWSQVYLWTPAASPLEIKRGPDEPGDLGHRDNSIRVGFGGVVLQ